MEENFRNSLIIISTLIIAAIFVHGLWTIRKNKNPYKLKTTSKEGEPLQQKLRDYDHSGFDQDGVSQIKVVNKNDLSNSNDSLAVDNDEISSKRCDPDVVIDIQVTSSENRNDEVTPMLDLSVVKEEVGGLFSLNESSPKEEIKSLYNDPVSKPKPKRKISKRPTKKKMGTNSNNQTLKRNQIEINFGNNDSIIPEELPNVIPSVEEKIEPEVLSISVMVPQGQIISGAALLPSLLTLGMKFGEMDVFHRHQDNAGNGKVTFSLVNAMNPGTFDVDNMETFVTQGVSLFMMLPNAENPFEIFEQMLTAAKQIAIEFNGQLFDDKRSVLTKQTEQHYVTKIRDFERKSRLASL